MSRHFFGHIALRFKQDELEALLRQKDQGSDQSVSSPPPFESLPSSLDNPQWDPNFSFPSEKHTQDRFINPSTSAGATQMSSGGDMHFFAGANLLKDQPFSHITEVPESGKATLPTSGFELIWPNWPANVPHPDLLRHL